MLNSNESNNGSNTSQLLEEINRLEQQVQLLEQEIQVLRGIIQRWQNLSSCSLEELEEFTDFISKEKGITV